MSIDQWRKQRGTLKAKLTVAKNFAAKTAENVESTTKEEIASRLQHLEESYAKFQHVQQELLAVVPTEEYEARDAIEETEYGGALHSDKGIFNAESGKLEATVYLISGGYREYAPGRRSAGSSFGAADLAYATIIGASLGRRKHRRFGADSRAAGSDAGTHAFTIERSAGLSGEVTHY